MSLNWLIANHFRNLSDIEFRPSGGLNLIYGQNGSGKTSLLEACYFLAMGRSFRDVAADPVIERNQDQLLLRAGIRTGNQSHELGMTRDRGGNRDLRVNGEKVLRGTEMARLLPMLVLGPQTVDLLLGAPELRRRFLNWGLFHVEQSAEAESFPRQFTRLWDEANRCLRQRNELLRADRSTDQELATWSSQLAESSEQLDILRKQYIEAYQPVFASTVAEISQLEGVELTYFRGWREDSSLSELFIQDIDIDKKRGFTQRGFQRADVRISVGGQPAAKVCSRGELKALVWSMVLSQGVLAHNAGQLSDSAIGHETLYLVDDLASEFDEEHRRRVCHFLLKTGQQILLTGVESETLVAACGGQYEGMFHVKHGHVNQEQQ